jgi:hypothetical protein
VSGDANAAPFALSDDSPWRRGPWRTPVNTAADAVGTIHDDATAQALGLRGGTVAGSIHLQQTAPLGRAAFGPGWNEVGALSLYFRHATRGGEPVRASFRALTADQIELALQTPEGALVAEGTASRAFDPDCPLRQRLAALGPPPETLRILKDVTIGGRAETTTAPIPRSRNDADRATLTEPMPPDPPDLPRALPYNLMIDVLRAPEPLLAPLPEGAVGLYGAIALAWFTGPLREKTPYRVRGIVRGLMDTPQTEALWYETEALDEHGAPLARLLLLARVMKASTALWRPL